MGLWHNQGMETRGLFSILLDYFFFVSLPLHALFACRLRPLLQPSRDMGLCLKLSLIQACIPFGAVCVSGRSWQLIPVPNHRAVSKAVLSLRAASWYWFGTRAQARYSCGQQRAPKSGSSWWRTSWHFPSPEVCTRELVASGYIIYGLQIKACQTCQHGISEDPFTIF